MRPSTHSSPFSNVSLSGVSFSGFSKAAIVAPLVAMVALAGCAKKKPLPDNANQLGIGGGAGSAQPGTSRDFTVNVGDRIFFTTDSTSLTAQARQTLDKQAAWLGRYASYRITIEGHADERGTREYNLGLGARRAAAARDYLAARGVSRSRMKTISFGKERPVAVCNDISCWSQNRRAVTVLSGGNS